MSQRGSMTPQGVRTNSLTVGAMTENTVGFCCFSGRRESINRIMFVYVSEICFITVSRYLISALLVFTKVFGHFCHWVNTVKRQSGSIIPLLWQKLCLKVMTQGNERVCACVRLCACVCVRESDCMEEGEWQHRSLSCARQLSVCSWSFFLNSRSPEHTNICGGFWRN